MKNLVFACLTSTAYAAICETDSLKMVVYFDEDCTQVNEAETKKSGHVPPENVKYHSGVCEQLTTTADGDCTAFAF